MLLLEYDVPAGQHLPSGQYTIFGRNFNILKFVSVSELFEQLLQFALCAWLIAHALILICALQGMGGENMFRIGILLELGLILLLCSRNDYTTDCWSAYRQEVRILSGDSWSKGLAKKDPSIVTHLVHTHFLYSLPELHALPIPPQPLMPNPLAANLALGHVFTVPVSTQVAVTGFDLLLLWLWPSFVLQRKLSARLLLRSRSTWSVVMPGARGRPLNTSLMIEWTAYPLSFTRTFK